MGWISKLRRNQDRGAQLVEFALLAPLLILLVLGIVELGWLFSQNNDVKHGAREGARAAAVNRGDNASLLSETCDAMDLAAPATVTFEDSATGEIGSTGVVTVTSSPTSLSGLGLIEAFLPSTLKSSIEFRLEQRSDAWSNTSGSC